MNILKVYRLSERATLPTRATNSAAGLDIFSAEDNIVPARSQVILSTDIQLEIPDNCYGHLTSRSGLATKHSIHVGAGIIDSDYRGNLKLLLLNHSDSDYHICIGDRVAQLIIIKIERPTIIEVGESSELSETRRGCAGFGSSGY